MKSIPIISLLLKKFSMIFNYSLHKNLCRLAVIITIFRYSNCYCVNAISNSEISAYFDRLTNATYNSILAMVEPSTGLPHDRFDASLYDIFPQFAVIRSIPYSDSDPNASIRCWRSTTSESIHTGHYGLKIEYTMPSGTWGSYNINLPHCDISQASSLQFWVKGAQGGEKFEFVLWSDCQGPFPGRPSSAEISVSQTWELMNIPLKDFESFADLSSLCRLSIGFNDAMHSGGTIYLDEIVFVDTTGNRIQVQLNEETSVTNICLYISSVLMALDLGLEDYSDVVTKLTTTLSSIDSLYKWHGFPQTHNHVVSLTPSTGDTCFSFVDLGNFAASLILLRQRMPETELSSRATALLDAMEWDWFYDPIAGLPYGCRYSDESASTGHYDWLCADSRLGHFISIGTENIPDSSWNNLRRTHEQPWCVDSTHWHYEPGWDGGGLFMAFLPAIFLDEKDSLSTSTRNFTLDQICYYNQIGASAWGWSATALPPYGEEYCGYGCFNDSILVPHASIMAIHSVGEDTIYGNLIALESLGARQPVTNDNDSSDFGFRSSVNWVTGGMSSVYLVLDQGMSFLSLANYINHDTIQTLFCQDTITFRAVESIPDYKNSCSSCSNVNNNMNIPNSFHLYQNYPNPFNPLTKISYFIPKSSFITLKIFNIQGQEVQILVDKLEKSGKHSATFDASQYPTGLYFYRLQAEDNFQETKKMLFLK